MTLKPPVRSRIRKAEDAPRVGGPAAAHGAPQSAPVRHLAPVDVARAQHDVGVFGRLDQERDLGRVVREVGVHLDDEIRAPGKGVIEPGDVGGAEALLRRSVKHLDVVTLGREAVGDLAGAVGRVVVDDEDAASGGRCSRAASTIGSMLRASL